MEKDKKDLIGRAKVEDIKIELWYTGWECKDEAMLRFFELTEPFPQAFKVWYEFYQGYLPYPKKAWFIEVMERSGATDIKVTKSPKAEKNRIY